MSNPFDNVPSSANLPETPDKKDIANLAELVSRIEDATRRFEASAKSSEELAEAVFEALLDDDGTMKDFGHSCEIRMMLQDEATTRAIFHDRLKRQLNSIPQPLKRPSPMMTANGSMTTSRVGPTCSGYTSPPSES